MKYLVADYALVRAKIDTIGMPRSKDGKLIMPDKLLQVFDGESEEEKLHSIMGTVVTNKEAKHLLTLKNWKI